MPLASQDAALAALLLKAEAKWNQSRNLSTLVKFL
jgi:hypothetical protein